MSVTVARLMSRYLIDEIDWHGYTAENTVDQIYSGSRLV